MARRSTKENKNIYQTTRENLDLTREEASELLETVSPERIEKIENERSLPYPDEVLLMSDKYKQPTLCSYYCANQCPIGQQYVPEIKIKDLSQIVLETIASLNVMQKKKERLIEITVDGKISDDEIGDFIYIQKELEKISIAVETLQLWCERMLDTLIKLDVLRKVTASGAFGFTPEELEAYSEAHKEAGYTMVSHSEQYRQAYKPAYRIVLESIFSKEYP